MTDTEWDEMYAFNYEQAKAEINLFLQEEADALEVEEAAKWLKGEEI